MTRTGQDIVVWEGEFKEIPIAVIDGAGAPIDLTGAAISWVLTQRGLNGAIILRKKP